ncbi:MAG: transposase [Lachnospiraceae bacterium]|nr:transposase [Lachnospiraceae bacterium]MBQ6546096.1 transposase [Lachnospiraceae bacterium]
MKQQTFSDYEYENRRRRTRRDLFLATMDEIIPWNEWTEMIQPYYPQGKRGRKPKDLETMLRMYLLQEWYHLTGEGSEDAVYDSYAMRSFIHVDFFEEQVPDSTTLLRFRQMMEKNGLALKLANELAAILREKKLVLLSGTMADAALAAMPEGEA